MDWPTGSLDSFRVEEAYNWRDDVMEITRRIVHETDEARLFNIANHFEVDLSEIRSFLEMKQQQQRKPQTNADRVRAMTDEELAELLTAVAQKSANKLCESLKSVEVDLSSCDFHILYEAHLNWLKKEEDHVNPG